MCFTLLVFDIAEGRLPVDKRGRGVVIGWRTRGRTICRDFFLRAAKK
jgi:hypothetical protein